MASLKNFLYTCEEVHASSLKENLQYLIFMLPAAPAHSLHLQQYYANTENYALNVVSDIRIFIPSL